jgi:hypothetical protein
MKTGEIDYLKTSRLASSKDGAARGRWVREQIQWTLLLLHRR